MKPRICNMEDVNLKEKIEKIDNDKLDKIAGGSKIGDYIKEKYSILKIILEGGDFHKCKKCGAKYIPRKSCGGGGEGSSSDFCPECCRKMMYFKDGDILSIAKEKLNNKVGE